MKPTPGERFRSKTNKRFHVVVEKVEGRAVTFVNCRGAKINNVRSITDFLMKFEKCP